MHNFRTQIWLANIFFSVNTMSDSLWDKWLHLAITMTTQDQSVRIYRNGKVTRSETHLPKNNTETLDGGTGQLVFGRHYVDVDDKYGPATFDEFRSWNNVLSESEIKVFCRC